MRFIRDIINNILSSSIGRKLISPTIFSKQWNTFKCVVHAPLRPSICTTIHLDNSNKDIYPIDLALVASEDIVDKYFKKNSLFVQRHNPKCYIYLVTKEDIAKMRNPEFTLSATVKKTHEASIYVTSYSPEIIAKELLSWAMWKSGHRESSSFINNHISYVASCLSNSIECRVNALKYMSLI